MTEFESLETKLTEWVEDRPDIIKSLAKQLKPWLTYRNKKTGQYYTIRSYCEDGTVTVDIVGNDDPLVYLIYQMAPYAVFGVKPEDLEEIKYE